ncbi:MAG: carbohydrate ABC transporter permease [Clostridia bacterium]|nr:carbohydrate ABC transporter permease [Clostridia bacterium]
MKVKEKLTKGTEPVLWAKIIIYAICILAAFICLVPLINVISVSFSTNRTAASVFLFPREISTESYKVIFAQKQVWRSLGVSAVRVVYAVALSTVLTVLMAFPLSRDEKRYPTRRLYVGILILCMLFDGGMVPKIVLMINWLHLGNTVSSLVLPLAVNIFNVILCMNFFRQLPKELEEAAYVDGASNMQALFKIIIPVSKPVMATIMMFTFVNHWNDYFTALVYIHDLSKYPFQTYIRAAIQSDDIKSMMDLQNYLLVSDKTVKSAQIVVGMLPLLVLYPLSQKYFATGFTLGAVKG